MRRTPFLLVLLCCSATYTVAQEDYYRVEVYGGYSYVNAERSLGEDRQSLNGFNASVTGNLSRYVGLKFDYAYHRDSMEFVTSGAPINVRLGERQHSFLGGVQFKDNSTEARVKPFAHFLAGANHIRVTADTTRSHLINTR